MKSSVPSVSSVSAPRLNRRRFLAAGGGMTLMMAHPGLLQAAGAGSFATTSFGGAWGEAYRSQIIEPFQKATGVAVNLKLGSPAEWLTSGLVTRRRPDVDLLMLPYPQSIQAVLQDLGRPLTVDEVPNLANVHPVWWDQYNRSGVGIDYVAYGVAVRSDLLPMPLKSWKDLWDPAFKNKLALPDISTAGAWEMLVMAARLNGGDENNLDPGFEALKALKPNIKKFIRGGNESAQLLESGEIVAHVMSTNITPYALQDAGRPVDFLVLEEGSMCGMVSYHLAKAAANPGPALEFINFALDAEQQTNFCSALMAGPVVNNAPLKGKAAERVPPLERLVVFDWKVLAPKMPEYSERWNREIAS